MSEPHEEKSNGKPRLPNVTRLRRAIKKDESIHEDVREEMLQDLDKLVNEVLRSRSIISSIERLLWWFLRDAGWANESSKDATECDEGKKSPSEHLLGGILVRRMWFQSALRELQGLERSRREGRIG